MGRVAEVYRRLPKWQAFILSLMIASILALVTGIVGSLAGMYLYDRGTSTGNDIAVGLIGLHAVGTFVFVFVLSWLHKVHHEISARTPAFALLFCLSLAALTTLLFWGVLDRYYTSFASTGWILILFCGVAAMFLSHYLFVRRT